MGLRRIGLTAMVMAGLVLWAIPSMSSGARLDDALRKGTGDLGNAVEQTVDKTADALRQTKAKTAAALRKSRSRTGAALERTTRSAAGKRATATDPSKQPPAHGSNPHGQGGVAVVDIDPSNERPLSSDPSGKDSGEDAIVGRARGEQNADGSYHGHITILSLLGNELASVDTAPGETKHGPLEPLQTGVLDPLCDGTSSQVCLSLLTADSTTTATGSDNDFAIARASVLGLGVGAAESRGTIVQDADCQTAVGASKTANVVTPSTAVAQVANSATTSKSCRGQATETTTSSMVIGLGGVQVPIPAAGCADGTPDTVTGIPAVLPIVCNAEDITGATAVREALDVYVLQVGGMSVAKETTAASEASSVAPAEVAGTPQCSDGIDNDGDNLIDGDDPGCHSDNNADNPDSFNPADNDESNAKPKSPTTGSSGNGNGNGSGKPECSDNRDNDGDGLVDSDDPGCHVGNDINNAFNPNDDSEGSDGNGNGNGGGPAAASTTSAGSLPFTGSDVVGLTLAGLLMLAGGLLVRRREGASIAQ